MATPKVRTLARAVDTLGSRQALADALGVTVDLLAEWLEGMNGPPNVAYFSALEIVARGPFNGKPPNAE